jgi:hypothetical protein
MTDEDDPFAPFRSLFEAGREQGELAGMGVPVVPAPGGEPSPDQSTRAAVRNLYAIIEGASTSESPGSPAEFWQRYLDAVGVDTGVSPAQFGSAALATYRVWLLNLSQLLVEGYTVRLLTEELVAEDHRSRTGTQEWLWRLPQADREQLLLRCLDLDEELVADMRNLRERRNELLYDMGAWTDTEIGKSLEEGRDALRVLDRLDDHVTGGSGFQFLPSGGEDRETDD